MTQFLRNYQSIISIEKQRSFVNIIEMDMILENKLFRKIENTKNLCLKVNAMSKGLAKTFNFRKNWL